MTNSTVTSTQSTEASVYQRYAAASQNVEAALCCPVQYVGDHLKVIPQEIIDKDYGCGDPSVFVKKGDTVVDLGSGTGKLCYIMAQVVGPAGRVIGVDCNTEMLALARKYRDDVAGKIGYSNVDFRYGMIQDLQLDLELLNKQLVDHPIDSSTAWLASRQLEEQLRADKPLIANGSVDCVVSNCVLNLVRQQDRLQLFGEIFRVLKPGGRAVISDIVCDKTVPEHLQQDGYLWSGCLSGAFREDLFLEAFANAGFHGITIEKRQAEPWQTIEGIEFRSMTVIAWKSPAETSSERSYEVIYKGPFRKVEGDKGVVFERGQKTLVSRRTQEMLTQPPYENAFEFVQNNSSSCCEASTGQVTETKSSTSCGPAPVLLTLPVSSGGACCSPDKPCC